MRLSLFVLLALCIAASYVRASDDTATVGETVAAEVDDTKPNADSPSTAATESKDDGNQSSEVQSSDKTFGHSHKDHHEHKATITVDVHNIFDLFKQQLKQTEQRIIAAIGKGDSSSSSSSSEKSYRTADRNAKKQEKQKNDEEKGKKNNEQESDEDDD